MTVVLRTTHQVPVKFKDLKGVTFWISPLKVEHKQLLSEAAVQTKGGAKSQNVMKAVFLAVKFGLKAVDGLKNLDGSKYEVELAADGSLADDCVEDMLNLPCGYGVSTVISHFAYGQIDLAKKVNGAEVSLDDAKIVKKK